MKALLAGSVQMDFPHLDKTPDKSSFLYWVLERPAFAQAHAARQLFVFKQLKQHRTIKTVKEFFGGAGLGTGIVQKLFDPGEHEVYEIAEECIEHLKNQAFSKNLIVKYGDAKETLLNASYADLFFCDFPLFNPMHLLPWDAQIDNLFKHRPQAIYLNDTSFWSRHLHEARYGAALGTSPLKSDDEYIRAYSQMIHERYGYSVLAVAIHRGASFIYVESDNVLEPVIKRITRDDARLAMDLW